MNAAAAHARAVIEAFHRNVNETDRQQRELQTKESEQQFHDMYSPCNPSSTFHDLQCGHRIQTEYTASCGVTCVRSMQGQPFACPTCLINVVRAEVALDSLTLGSSNDSAMKGTEFMQEDRIQYFANKYVAAMLKKGYRGCKAASKIDEPRMQFFDQFMRQDGFGGVDEVPSDEKTTKPRRRPGASTHIKLARQDTPYRRPGRWDYRDPTSNDTASSNVVHQIPGEDKKEDIKISQRVVGDAMGELHSEQSVNTGVDLVPQNEATEAVRKAMEAFALLST